jgi:hypothetical protein
MSWTARAEGAASRIALPVAPHELLGGTVDFVQETPASAVEATTRSLELAIT